MQSTEEQFHPHQLQKRLFKKDFVAVTLSINVNLRADDDDN